MQHLKFGTIALALLAMASFSSNAQNSAAELSKMQAEFQNPPSSARPRVWWHWMNGNITKDGIKKDIDWMHRAGIGGFHNFDAGMSTPAIVEKRLEYMTDEWKDAFQYAISLADSYDMEVGIASSPGWSCMGGPWVAPKDAMKKLTWRETIVEGGKSIKMTLPAPYKTVGTFQDVATSSRVFGDGSAKPVEEYYEDIAVIAVKLPAEDQTMAQMGATVSVSGGDFTLEQLTNGSLADGQVLSGDNLWIQYTFPKAKTIKAVTVGGLASRSQWSDAPYTYPATLQSSNDGVHFTDVAKIPCPTNPVYQQTIEVPATTAKYFRLSVDKPATNAGGMGFGRGPAQISISEFVLFPTEKVNHFEEKAAFATPHDVNDYPTVGGGKYAQLKDVVDLTNRVDSEGNLSWNAPKGNWKIYRFGFSLTGHKNSPASPEATGLEVDKFDVKAWTKYFHTYLDMYQEASGGMLGQKGIQYILTDSYEAGPQTWTPEMMKQFQTRRGYNLLYWLPVLTGQIVGSPEESDQFLFDFRETIGELYAENYDRINEFVKEYDLKGRYSESQENGRIFQVDGMDIKRTATIPMSAAWIPESAANAYRKTMNEADVRESASVAHIFGQNIAAAESMTVGGGAANAYTYFPGNLKPIADSEMAAGLNRFVIHESAHQPSDDHIPGLSLMSVGQWFNRHETWAEQAKAWTDYLARSCYMLQQGKFIADVLVYYGEGSNITGQYGLEFFPIPEGYNYDFVNPTALKQEVSVKNGKFVTRSGQSYEALYLDKNMKQMSLSVLRKLAEFAQAGGIICGNMPERPASKSDSVDEWNSLVKKIWGGTYPNVSTGTKLIAVLKEKGIKRDVTYPSSDEFRFVHRRTDNADIYWVNKPSERYLSTSLGFRVNGKVPHVWDPVTGTISDVSYQIQDDVTYVTMTLLPDDAQFIVFAGEPTTKSLTLPKKVETELMTVTGAWDIKFQERRGAPESATFDKLMSYTESPVAGIKYFAGEAVYTKKIVFTGKDGAIVLDLGDVRNVAEVKVNGKYVATLWKFPYKVDVTEYLNEGENDLEIKVVNSWKNRLIGDQQPETTEKITFTSASYYKPTDAVIPSGLLGPVRLISVK
ncbi:MAG: hypothetical protein MJZ16_06595 [Bacteroidales bacterium]|nr:hypothetical protein [Bacteroidales bacterium]